MPNVFSDSPTLAENFPKKVSLWTDPVTGLSVPKDPEANLKWRADMLEAAEGDEEMQADLYTACSQSILFWINAFVFTLRIFESNESGEKQQAEFNHLPFITWAIQDDYLLRLEHCVDEGESQLTDKSRDMGATWCNIALYTHRFLFRDDESHLMMSRKEDAVDILDGQPKNYPFGTLSAPGTLFGKIDYILSRLPEWMLPRMSRKKMHLVNLDGRSRIDGESSNATAGSSDRRTSIFLDEMAKMQEGESIWRSTADVTACRLPCSTPNGAGTTFSKVRLSGRIPVFVLPWWEHPEKGLGRHIAKDDLGRYKIRSPWYDAEETARTPKELAIEVDMDHVGSGDLFFEANIIAEHKKLFAKPPVRKLNIVWLKTVTDEKIGEACVRRDLKGIRYSPFNGHGVWRVWCQLEKGRPDQTRSYTIGCDISKGQGASNSTASIICNETGEKIAEFADANKPPYEFAKLVCAAALWVGGRTRALVIWENNGDPGFDFGRQIVHVYRYPNVYFDKVAGTVSEKRGKRFGWRSSPEKKAQGLGQLRRAYARGSFINHSAEALDEALMYVHYEGGGIGPSELQQENDSARKTHGDRVIADMLCVVALVDMPKNRRAEGVMAPERSLGHRFKQFQRAKKMAAKGNRFDFAAA
jgi:hypothetical protein